MNPDVGGGGGGGALSAGVAYAPAPVAMDAAGGDGDELCIEEPVEVSRPGPAPEEAESGPPQRPLGSSRGILRRFFHLARRFWNQT